MKRNKTYAPAPHKRIGMVEYQALAQRTSPEDGHDRVDNALLGLLGETGEIADLYKKQLYQSAPNTPVPTQRYKEEVGDVLWYIAELASGRRVLMQDLLDGDFADYDESAWKNVICGNRDDMRKIIICMCGRANEACIYISDCDFSRAGCHLRRLVSAAASLAAICGFTLQDAAAANIEKLKKRYPNGFDAEISAARYK